MALDEHGVPDRNIDPNSFRGDSSEPSRHSEKKADIGFLFGPKTQQKPVPIKLGDDDGQLASQLKWAKLVADRKVLKSRDRTKLKKHLDELLDGLNQRYIKGKPRAFPSGGELTKLTEVIFTLAKLLGVKKSGFGDLVGAMSRIENRFTKMSLVGFADALRDRLCQVPTSPASVVHQAAEKNADNKAVLDAIKKFLTGEPWGDKTTAWEDWYQTVWQLKFPTSELMASGQSNLLQTFGSADQKKLLAYLLMMDLRRQQLEWNTEYAKSTRASLQWIYLLQRPEDFTKLTKVFCGDAPSPAVATRGLAQSANRDRQSKYRKKHKADKDAGPDK